MCNHRRSPNWPKLVPQTEQAPETRAAHPPRSPNWPKLVPQTEQTPETRAAHPPRSPKWPKLVPQITASARITFRVCTSSGRDGRASAYE
ncbi:hypothetical protein ACVWY6_003060 [Williamsia sp. R60]